ncbi:MAG: DUF3306 domain-containing protein [Rhodospirillales bacterium]|nr:DUF3306 domain-containing protein [Rhodospirillales bacterium]
MSAANGEPEGRLSRWSRLKRVGADGDEPPQPAPPTPTRQGSAAPVAAGLTEKGFVQPLPPLAGWEEGEAAYEAAPVDAKALLDPDTAALKAFPVQPEEEGDAEDGPGDLTPEQLEAMKDLPPVESLTKNSDFKPFFAPNVPDFLKRSAFKALWASTPFFNFRDGLNDYDDNFRIIDKLITALDSDYRSGKGYDFGEDTKDDDDDLGDSEGHGVSEDGNPGADEQQVADANEEGSESNTDTKTPKEPRQNDVRPPDDAV